MEKIEFKDFPITDTPIDADNLNLLQNNVENEIEAVDTAINEVNNKFNYSTNEQVVGMWIDGKPLYRKVIFLNSLPNNDNVKFYNHNISDVDIIYFDKCFAIWNYGQSNQFTNQLPYFNYAGNHIYLSDPDRTGFNIKTTIDRTALKGFITLEYTKTTD